MAIIYNAVQTLSLNSLFLHAQGYFSSLQQQQHKAQGLQAMGHHLVIVYTNLSEKYNMIDHSATDRP